MTGKYFVKLFLLLAIAVIFTSSVYADQTDQLEQPGLKDVNFSAGASLRLRQEVWTNVVSLGTDNTRQKDRNFFRLRASLWGGVDVGKYFDAYARITTEPKYYLGPYHPGITGASHGQYTD